MRRAALTVAVVGALAYASLAFWHGALTAFDLYLDSRSVRH